jgi:hypothetical protein
MPISVLALHNQILAELDAEGSDRYTFDQDTKYAINAAQDIVVALFNEAFAQNKLSPEQLRDLTKTKVWQANQYSRVAFKESETGHSLWSVIAVYPKPLCNKGVSSSPQDDKSKSLLRSDISFISAEHSAKRLSLEEWSDNKKNAFMPGNTVLSGGLAEYGYLDFSDYSSSSYSGNSGEPELEVRPAIPGQLVAISYLKHPNRISTTSDSIEFPSSMFQLFVDMALNTIAVKQGDGTNLWSVTSVNIQKLVNALL